MCTSYIRWEKQKHAKRSKTHVLYACFTPAYFNVSFLAYMRRGFYLVAFHIIIALPEGQSNQASLFLEQHDQARVRKYCSLKISRYLTLWLFHRTNHVKTRCWCGRRASFGGKTIFVVEALNNQQIVAKSEQTIQSGLAKNVCFIRPAV